MSTELLKTFEEVASIFVVGRRWFDKVNGNTYHSAEIYVNNDFVHKIDYAYGYGDQYMWNGFLWLKENNFLDYYCKTVPTPTPLQADLPMSLPNRYCREKGIKFNYTVADVKRKKDL